MPEKVTKQPLRVPNPVDRRSICRMLHNIRLSLAQTILLCGSVSCNNCNRHLDLEQNTFCPAPLPETAFSFLVFFVNENYTTTWKLRSGSITEKKNSRFLRFSLVFVENLFARCNFAGQPTGRVNRKKNASDF